ncbi:MAG TPA: methyltransferase domain-containing protein [Victivallales bacterium]|nr:methyltransferase domain-containing protein [Victivallales bacterium]
MSSCAKKIYSDKVGKNFSQAAFSYERAAFVQRSAAERLADFISQNIPSDFHPRLVMELGAGTGFMTRKIILRFTGAKFLITDISDDMLGICRRKIFAMTGKKEAWRIEFELLDFNTDFEIQPDCDLMVSGFSFQWADDISNLMGRIYEKLPKGAILAFSMLQDGSLRQLRDLFAKLGIEYPVPKHPSMSEIRKFCGDFSIIKTEEYSVTSSHSSLRAFLQALKNVGAINPGLSKIQPSKLKKIISEAQKGEFKATYEIVNMMCRKR